jgi:D-arginine dehydrogenase
VSSHEFIIIGAGIAGASAAYELQRHGSAVLLEREPLPGHHTTGRSAAFLVDGYGGATVGKLTRGARGFLEQPPEGFVDAALVTPNPVLWIAREDQRASLAASLANSQQAGADAYEVDFAVARELCPALREGYVAVAAVEPSAMHIDVAGLLDAFLRGFRRRGGEVATKAEATRIERKGDAWEVDAGGRTYRAAHVVNAAGAWCDSIGSLAGARPIGLQPRRRTAITFDPPANCDVRSWPCVIDADEDFYLKPEGGQLLASPCDETPSEPCDASAEDYEVALAAERSPVIGMDPECAGFFWLAGQGGFGIMTSPAAARAAAGLIVNGSLPGDLRALGLTAEMLSVERLGEGDR